MKTGNLLDLYFDKGNTLFDSTENEEATQNKEQI